MVSNTQLDERRKLAVARGVSCAFPIFADRASEAELWDVEGRRYIDLVGGMGALAVGHSHPKIVAAVREQLDRFSHTFFGTAPYEGYVAVAERLNAMTKVGTTAKTLLVTTGTEAVENSVKIARAFTKRRGVVVFSGAFHGRSMFTMSMTGKVKPYKESFGPFPADIYRVPFPYAYRGVSSEDTLAAIHSLFESEIEPQAIAAIVIEPLQGEGGFLAAPPDFLVALRKLCDVHGIVLVADEVQCGFGRTGRLFSIEHSGVEPDLVAVGKSLGAGLPLAAVVGKAEIMDAVGPGGLGGTYAGNPLACAAALAVIDVLEQGKLMQRAEEIGARMEAGFRRIQTAGNRSVIGDIRGQGAMLGIELVEDPDSRAPARSLTEKVIQEAARRGLLLAAAGRHFNVIRVLVPLTISNEVLDEAIAIIEGSIQHAVASEL
ncbi:4-aminobutyrate--2-oxoglutarate transaminase [Mesorhizobium sp. M0047]|uniref:4-aminobutyrate--2-oxoglutarate transaminase n=1 Tax=Mesorhizobium sp. M0047 TaxID=2956859 RepID=UPI0033354402